MNANGLRDEIKILMDEYMELQASAENNRRLACWEAEVCARDQWHGRARREAFRNEGAVPITVDLQHPLWLQRFPQDLARTFTEPELYLRFYLQKRIDQFRQFRDDTPLEPLIPIWLHTPFEMSLFGMPVHYFESKDPLIDLDHPVCTTPEQLVDLAPIDFTTSGMMPLAHRMYHEIGAIAGDLFTVLFPEWIRGSFGVALYLGGYNNMLLNMLTQPDFFHGLMARITDERKNYFIERRRIMDDREIPPGSLFNDEVDNGIIGPRHYRDYIKPYEIELGEFHGRISYWHSCGDTSGLVAEIADMGLVDVLDISGFTDVEKALDAIGGSLPRLDIRLHPLEDLQNATPERMAQRLRQVIRICRQHDVPAVSIRVSGLNPWKTPREDFDQIRKWIDIARAEIESGAKPV